MGQSYPETKILNDSKFETTINLDCFGGNFKKPKFHPRSHNIIMSMKTTLEGIQVRSFDYQPKRPTRFSQSGDMF